MTPWTAIWLVRRDLACAPPWVEHEVSGAVLLHLETAAYRHLNEVGALIWTLLEGEPTRDELVEAIRRHVTDPPDRMSAELDAFLEALRERGLIEMATAD